MGIRHRQVSVQCKHSAMPACCYKTELAAVFLVPVAKLGKAVKDNPHHER